MKKRKRILSIIILLTMMSLSACTFPGKGSNESNREQAGNAQPNAENNSGQDQSGTGFVLTGPGSYDSADTAVVVKKNEDDNSVTFLNLVLGKRYTLGVDGTAVLYDKYGEAVSLEQIREGDIVDITFVKNKKRLNSLQLSSQAWVMDQVNRYEINNARKNISIGKDIYKLTEDTLFLAGGRQIDRMDLNPEDIITVKGIGTRALSVSVEKGHGYLRLINDENFVGGWIEIGQSNIRKITAEMLLVVPEGSHQVTISHKGGGGVKDIIINRNEELTLDVGDLEVAEAKYGTVIFSLSPSKAMVYVDGEQVDTTQPLTLEYGIHQLIAKADGYQTSTSYLKVAQETSGIDVVLEKLESNSEEEDKDDAEDSSKEEDKDAEEDTIVGNYKVYVDSPEDVEVYLDGNYVGLAPCNFKKATGAHIITLRKNGYETRSYTVQIDKEEKDIRYSFDPLTLAPKTVSGN